MLKERKKQERVKFAEAVEMGESKPLARWVFEKWGVDVGIGILIGRLTLIL